MSLHVEKTEDGYKVTITVNVKHWTNFIVEIGQFLKLYADEDEVVDKP